MNKCVKILDLLINEGIFMLKSKSAKAKKLAKAVKKTSNKIKAKAKKNVTAKGKSLLKSLKGKLKHVKGDSSKALNKVKVKAIKMEDEIADYVKANPIKSVSAVALTALIAGFLSRLKK